MNLLLTRTTQDDQATMGELCIDGDHECWTLESASPILAGRYQITMYLSPHFGRYVPMLNNVPGHTFIEIHPGNTKADTEGCILVGGSEIVEKDRLGGSGVEAAALTYKIQKAIRNGEEVWIEITENFTEIA